MNILSSWKKSFSLISWDNIKDITSAVFSALPQLYTKSILFVAPLLIALNLFIYFLTDSITLHYGINIYIAMISLIGAIIAMMLYLVVQSTFNKKSLIDNNKHHMIIGAMFLALVFFLFLKDSGLPFWKYFLASVWDKNLVVGSKAESLMPPSLIADFIGLELDKLIIGASYIMLFFLETPGRLIDIVTSIWNVITFICLQLPAFAFYTTIFSIPVGIVTILIKAGFSYIPWHMINLVLSVTILLFATPLIVAFIYQIYRLLRQ